MRYIVLLIFIGFSFHSKGQETDTLSIEEVDTIITGQEAVLVEEDPEVSKRFNPRKASLYSAILPGLGQAYNKKYWKVPIVYGGFFALGYTVDFYHENYTRFRQNLFAQIDDNPETINTTGFTEQQLRRLIDRSRRERDFYMILTGVLYLLQIAEAHINAHLKEFDLNPDLKVQVDPVVNYNEGFSSGVSLKLKFR